jgi:hypothetical protein
MIKSIMSTEIVYKYWYGNEHTLGGYITVLKCDDNEYFIIFHQIGMNGTIFSDIRTEYTVITRDYGTHIDAFDMVTKTIEMRIEAKNNPKPESLFQII